MKGKFLFVVGLGIGYVLGTRAGRERYEQIRKAAEDVWNQPKVQEGVETVKGFAMSRVGDVSDAVLDGAKKLVRQVSGTPSGTTTSSSRSTTAASKTSSSSGASPKSASATRSSKSTATKPSGSASSKSTSSGSGSSGSS